MTNDQYDDTTDTETAFGENGEAVQYAEFPYGQVEAAISRERIDAAAEVAEREETELTPKQIAVSRQLAADMFRRFLLWATEAEFAKSFDRAVGRRVIAACFVICSEAVGGQSLRSFCRVTKSSAPTLSTLSGDFSRHFDLRVSHQAHAANFKPAKQEAE